MSEKPIPLCMGVLHPVGVDGRCKECGVVVDESLAESQPIGPCPFCGRSVARLVEAAPDVMGHYVQCDNPCYARGPVHQGRMAIRLWNQGLPHEEKCANNVHVIRSNGGCECGAAVIQVFTKNYPSWVELACRSNWTQKEESK